MEKPEGAPIIGRRTICLRRERTIGFVHNDQVGEFDDPALDTLKFIATARQQQQNKHISHFSDRGFGLTDTDRFHDNDIETGRLDNADGLAGVSRDAAQCLARR